MTSPVVKELKMSMEQIATIAEEAFLTLGSAVLGGGNVAAGQGKNLDELVATAVAIAWAESEGNAVAHNDNYKRGGRDDSYGLWQINMLGSMGPRRRALFGIQEDQDLFDPRTNARAMVKLWVNKGRSFRDWTTYNLGTYKLYMAQAREAVKNKKPFATGQGEVVTTNFLTDFIDMVFGTLFDFLKQGFLRIAGFVGGAALIIGAIVLVAKRGVK